MKNKNLFLIFSASAVVVLLAIIVPVLQNRQEVRQHAAGIPSQVNLPSQSYRNPYYYNGRGQTQLPPVTVTLPPENQRFLAPNDTIPPQLTITAPVNGATMQAGAPVQITATATDNTG